jgi:transketolase
VAWIAAIERLDGPTSLLLSRQNLPPQKRSQAQVNEIAHGGYVLSEAGGKLTCVLIATGSEVQLAIEAQKALAQQGIGTRVVSMPCTSVFDRQGDAWRAQVLPDGVPRVAVEAGITDFWRKYVGAVGTRTGAVIGVDRYGESAPAADVFKYLGITAEAVVEKVKGLL